LMTNKKKYFEVYSSFLRGVFVFDLKKSFWFPTIDLLAYRFIAILLLFWLS
jgi:hypothetical protein